MGVLLNYNHMKPLNRRDLKVSTNNQEEFGASVVEGYMFASAHACQRRICYRHCGQKMLTLT